MNLNFKSNERLIKDLKEGSEAAFEEIFKVFWAKLYTIALSKTKSHDEAEEVIQSVFSSLWEKKASLSIHNLEQYLISALRNKIIDRIRTKLIHEKHWIEYRMFLSSQNNEIEETLHFNELSKSVENLLKKLPKKSQEVFRMNRLEGYSKKEIAKLMQISEKAIEYHITKSLKILRLQLRNLFF